MGSDVANLRRHIIYKSDNCLEIDVVSDNELEKLRRYGKIGWKSEVSGYTKENGISRPLYRKKYFYK
jgi:hypothetical protein